MGYTEEEWERQGQGKEKILLAGPALKLSFIVGNDGPGQSVHENFRNEVRETYLVSQVNLHNKYGMERNERRKKNCGWGVR